MWDTRFAVMRESNLAGLTHCLKAYRRSASETSLALLVSVGTLTCLISSDRFNLGERPR
ncbi:hypothetical protein B0O95_1186 [Mycetohabitans endofungorum]|uniref:Uncharacterized protein n=1 Tax=Mycetohabitans endofungorum TaxID=417203 RepID=A0A2P5K750_9BURK|nr:hypothetical protein B0O95_1186 [Mycetohabitans endofungorum]